ncbi:hypothetical protein SNK03_013388 [Fusarium graminearum]
MSYTDDDAFAYGLDSFLLPSSSPPLPADPPPANATWAASVTRQPSSDGIFGLGIYGEGLDLLEDYSDNLGLDCMGSMDFLQTEQMTLDVPPHEDNGTHALAISDSGFQNSSAPIADMFPQDELVQEHSVQEQHTNSSYLPTYNSVEANDNEQEQIDARYLIHSDNSPIISSIVDLEAKVDELLKWKTLQTKRGTELKRMMEEILEMLQNHEDRMNSDK